MRIHHAGHEILSLEDWYRWAPPKRGALHWKGGRSAKELARAWLRSSVPTPPEELRSLIEKTFGPGIVFEEAMPECIVQLDEFEGEQRNSDLVILCGRESERIVISIEAKADEPFGDTAVGDYYDCKLNTRSNFPNRIKKLSTALFGTEPDSTAVRTLLYQLVHSAAAALIAAKAQGANCAVFAVHEFHGALLNPKNFQRNMGDWTAFVRAFPLLTVATVATVQRNQILGPISVPGGGLIDSSIPLYLGNVVTELPSSA